MKTRLLTTIFSLVLFLSNYSAFAQEPIPDPEPMPELHHHAEFTDGQICSNGAKLMDGTCTVEKEIHDNAFSKYRALFIFSLIPVWFVFSGIYLAFGRNHKKLVAISLTVMGIFWILGIYTNTLPVSFG